MPYNALGQWVDDPSEAAQGVYFDEPEQESWQGQAITPYSAPQQSSSWLTPEWLMSDINQLLQRSRQGLKAEGGEGVLSQKEFENAYLVKREKDFDRFTRTGSFGGDTLYEYKDWTQDVEGGYDWGATGSNVRDNRYLSKKGTAYTDYLEAIGLSPEQGYGQETANIFDRESFVGGVERARGVPLGEGAPSGAFTEFTPGMMRKLHTGFYQPEIEEKRGSLIDTLIKRQKVASAKGRGIAGYGERERSRAEAGELYGRGVENIYENIEEYKAQGLQDIYDVLGQYQTIGEEF